MNSADDAPLPRGARPRPDRGALPFAALLTGIFTVCWLVAVNREGSWVQAPPWDQAWFHTIALRFKRTLMEEGFSAFVEQWVNYSKCHTPLVPTVSALLMVVFGESRAVAEAVLPLSTFVLVLSVFRASEWLYGRKTAYATAALSCTFPIALTLSRTYLFEHTFAALVAASCWALLASDSFGRLKPSLLFGVAAGLAALSRAAGPVLLVGPTLVAAFVAMRREGRWARLARLTAAVAVGVAVAGTWYFPNLDELWNYIHSVTYGDKAETFAGGQSGITLENLRYYLDANVLEGPGIPMLALALLAFVLGDRRRAPLSVSPRMAAVVAAYAIDFLLLLLASQMVGAVLFLPVMPMVALMIVRAVTSVPRPRIRALLGLGVAVCAIHHVVAKTFTFPVPQGRHYGRGPWASGFDIHDQPRGFPLWNHRNMFLDMAESVGKDPRTDFRVHEVAERIASIRLAPGSMVYVLADHPFFQINSLRLELYRRGHSLFLQTGEGASPRHEGPNAWLKIIRSNLNVADAVVVRDPPATEPWQKSYALAMSTLIDGRARPFELVGEPVELGDKSKARVFRRRSRAELHDAIPEGLVSTAATFGDPANPDVSLEAARFESLAPDDHLLTVSFRWNRPCGGAFPRLFAHLVTKDGEFAHGIHGPSPIEPADLPTASSRHVVVRMNIDGKLTPSAREQGYGVALGMLVNGDCPTVHAVGVRYTIESSLPRDNEATRVFVWREADGR